MILSQDYYKYENKVNWKVDEDCRFVGNDSIFMADAKCKR